MFECMSDACYFHLTVNLAGLPLTAIQAGDNTEEYIEKIEYMEIKWQSAPDL